MKLPSPLIAGHLVRRYKRFLADVELNDGTLVTAHTPNTGSMLQCAVPGHQVLISHSDNPKRKLAYTLELIEVAGFWVDTHTLRTNRVAEEALRGGAISELSGWQVTPEHTYGDSRIDFLLEQEDRQALVEVKNVTLLCGPQCACFPDAVTTRGQKHLRTLMAARETGLRAAVLFVVQRGEATSFRPADDIDPEYGRLLRQAVSSGVEALAYGTCVSPTETFIARRLPVLLD